ncbi:Uncharacterized protein GBIM_04431, partial [Gryllus bimaculatus]
MQNQAGQIDAAEKKFLRHMAGYTFEDQKRNDICQELNITSILDKIKRYRGNCNYSLMNNKLMYNLLNTKIDCPELRTLFVHDNNPCNIRRKVLFKEMFCKTQTYYSSSVTCLTRYCNEYLSNEQLERAIYFQFKRLNKNAWSKSLRMEIMTTNPEFHKLLLHYRVKSTDVKNTIAFGKTLLHFFHHLNI